MDSHEQRQNKQEMESLPDREEASHTPLRDFPI